MSPQKKKAQNAENQQQKPQQNDNIEEDMDLSEDEEGL